MGRWDNKKPKNSAPQTAKEAENFKISDNVGELLADVVNKTATESAGSVLAQANSSDEAKVEDLVSAPPPKFEEISRGFDNPSHGKEYGNHPKFDKFKNQKGSK